ncbi:N-glycosylase/DNA lyase [Athalia rosae]|uniref:N-glycosylase/DNA lyase n=1 Tax=Athalia rosae TaxID=37344 RepID=UPI002034A4A7|nr:N-glycosylase/DNA lyase [Athalia rosae]
MMKTVNKMPASMMKKIAFPDSELGLSITLNGGQSFRWSSLNNGESFRGVFAGRVWTLEQSKTHLSYIVHGPLADDSENKKLLSQYFRKEVSLKANIKIWSTADPHFEKACRHVKGVRILNQDVVENLFSFICSSNNNIIRISSMVDKLCRFFGEKLCVVDGIDYYEFPTVKSLARDDVLTILKEAGFGYRAGYIANAAKKLVELGGEIWLKQLHKNCNQSYSSAREKLITLPGIGPKVADCICLMSLGHLEAIPVDTHIFQVARALYLPHLETQKTVTPKIHNEVSTFLRELWGPFAGWAQTVVFCAKLNNNDLVSRTKKRSSRGTTEIPQKTARINKNLKTKSETS